MNQNLTSSIDLHSKDFECLLALVETLRSMNLASYEEYMIVVDRWGAVDQVACTSRQVDLSIKRVTAAINKQFEQSFYSIWLGDFS